MSKKKKLIPVILILIVAAIVAIVLIFTRGKKEVKVDGVVYVESVEEITGQGYLGTDRYLGVVEAQESKGVDAAEDRKIKEIFVSEGDVVKEGDPLFEYDTDEMNLKLKQLELELSNINNSINTMNLQIKELEEERSRVPADEQYEYTSQIQNYQAQINQLNFDVGNKQLEIDNQSKELENTTVYAPMDGVIKKINSESSNNSGPEIYNGYDEYGSTGGESEHFINIMAMGDYRVKATANELNVRNMTQGDAMIIRSRIDESITWQGVISTIDLEHPDNGNNDYYYYGGGGTTVTKYPFYVSVTSENDLMLGQHVYVEADNGQETVKTGIWLDSDYIMQDETGAYVWAENDNKRIEKRQITLGEYDEELMQYEVTSGLEMKDYIAFPEERIKEGMSTTTNIDEVSDMEDEGYYDEEPVYDEEGYDDDFYNEDDAMVEEYENDTDSLVPADGEVIESPISPEGDVVEEPVEMDEYESEEIAQ